MKAIHFLVILLLFAAGARAQRVMEIWPGKAPGAESWNWPEGQDTTEWGGNDPLTWRFENVLNAANIADAWIADHDTNIEGADAIWLAAMGPGIRPLGEQKPVRVGVKMF
jgi:hypothetical protein